MAAVFLELVENHEYIPSLLGIRAEERIVAAPQTQGMAERFYQTLPRRTAHARNASSRAPTTTKSSSPTSHGSARGTSSSATTTTSSATAGAGGSTPRRCAAATSVAAKSQGLRRVMLHGLRHAAGSILARVVDPVFVCDYWATRS